MRKPLNSKSVSLLTRPPQPVAMGFVVLLFNKLLCGGWLLKLQRQS